MAHLDAREIWRGPYFAWPESADTTSKPWAAGQWLDLQVSIHEASCRLTGDTPPPRPTNLPLVVSLLRPNSVLDYGGGSGWVFEVLQRYVNDLRPLRQVVAEVEDAIIPLRKRIRPTASLEFVPLEDPIRAGRIDLIYVNAALHYAPSSDQFFQAVGLLQPNTILLDGYLANTARQFYMTQHVYGAEVPVAIPILSETLSQLETRGFSVQFCVPMLGPFQGRMEYELPLQHLGAPYDRTMRYSILARSAQ